MSFGVVRVLGRRGIEVEVATFRTDSGYSDGRHPDAVAFSTAEEDARRRDFTINGMFYDPLTEELYDYVGGRQDLKRRLLRAIGDPRERIAEDKLRMLRAVRFTARFDLKIDAVTSQAIRTMASELSVVSSERILTELRGMLTTTTRPIALRLLREHCLLEQVLPEIADCLTEETNWRHVLAILGYWPHEISMALAIAGLLAPRPDHQAAQDAETIFRRLKGANEDRQRANWLVCHRHDFEHAPSVRRCVLKRRFTHPGCDELLDLHEATARATTGAAPDVDYCRQLRASLSAREIDPRPLLTGHDLITLGLRPGPRFGDILERVRDEQLDGKLADKDQALAMARSLAKETRND